MYDEPQLIHAGQAIDDRGSLTFCNDFDLDGVVRFYAITNHRQGFVRAWHGHRVSSTFLWPLRGTWKVATVGDMGRLTAELDDYVPPESGWPRPTTHVIDSRSILHIPGGWYHGHQNLTKGAILGVFSTATIDQVRGDDHRLPWDRWSEVWEERPR